MADAPSANKDKSTEPPAPEVLKPQADDASPAEETTTTAPAATPTTGKRSRHGSYRPSHKATFVGLIVVVAILAINAGIIAFVLKSEAKNKSQANQAPVTISQTALDKLGVNRSSVGDQGVQLVVNPDARFNGTLQVGGDVSVAGQLKLNSKFTASDASLTQLEAGNTSLSQLNVNGDGTLSNLTLREGLNVTGATHLQGAATFSQLVTVNNSLNVSGNLAVGGTLAVGAFQVTNLTIAGHATTAGSAPTISRGTALGSNGTVSISGNDAAGTVAANAGAGATSGLVACMTFRNGYGTIPHVVVSASAPVNAYVSRSTGGFCIYAGSALSQGSGYAFDYIVEQ
jgi:hypothetical protein